MRYIYNKIKEINLHYNLTLFVLMKFVFYVKSPTPSINKYQEQNLHALTRFIFYKQATFSLF